MFGNSMDNFLLNRSEDSKRGRFFSLRFNSLCDFNEAVKKVDDMTSTEMGKLTSGLNLPKGMF